MKANSESAILERINSPVNPGSYECSITVDCAVFGFQDNALKLLLVKRSIEPFKDCWMLPGGVMGETQTVEDAMNNVLFNLTGLKNIHQEQVKCYSAVDRHPIKRVITMSFYALIKPENHPVIAKNYISDVEWFSMKNLPSLGFDHDKIMTDALLALRQNLDREVLFGELLPKKFTLKELQDLYESILDEKLDRRNFRKKMLQTGLLKPANEKKAGAKGGPELYSIKRTR